MRGQRLLTVDHESVVDIHALVVIAGGVAGFYLLHGASRSATVTGNVGTCVNMIAPIGSGDPNF
jgi:hypothetical protein